MPVQFRFQEYDDISSTADLIHDVGMNTKKYLEENPDHQVVSKTLNPEKYKDFMGNLFYDCKLKTYRDGLKIRVYLAGPYFTDDHKKTIDQVRKDLMEMSSRIVVYSPFHDGIDFSEAGKNVKGEKSLVAKMIFSENIAAINHSDIVLALVDDRDPGTIMEIGYAAGKDIPVVTYSGQNYGVNLMISNSSVAHYTDLKAMVQFIWEHGSYLHNIYMTNNKMTSNPLGVIDSVTLAKVLLNNPGDVLEANR